MGTLYKPLNFDNFSQPLVTEKFPKVFTTLINLEGKEYLCKKFFFHHGKKKKSIAIK